MIFANPLLDLRPPSSSPSLPNLLQCLLLSKLVVRRVKSASRAPKKRVQSFHSFPEILLHFFNYHHYFFFIIFKFAKVLFAPLLPLQHADRNSSTWGWQVFEWYEFLLFLLLLRQRLGFTVVEPKQCHHVSLFSKFAVRTTRRGMDSGGGNNNNKKKEKNRRRKNKNRSKTSAASGRGRNPDGTFELTNFYERSCDIYVVQRQFVCQLYRLS